jgi:clan AA aspartic protease
VTVSGTVNAQLEAVLRLRVRGPGGAEDVVEAVIDTGYTGSLTLPTSVAASLGLAQVSSGRAVLADGSSRRFDSFAVELDWGGTWRGVVASALGDEVLVGMGLLAGHQLRLEALPGGAVEIDELPAIPTA